MERSLTHDQEKSQTALRQKTGEYPSVIRPETSCVKEIGYIDKGTGRHQSNTVYDPDGIARCLQASGDRKDPLKVLINESKTDRKHN